MSSMNNAINLKYDNLPSLFWIPKLHKNPYRERYIADSFNCGTKELPITDRNYSQRVGL
jgi:hypothetical protein